MKINLSFVKWHTVVICVSTWLAMLVWKKVNGHNILLETESLSIKQTQNLLVGSTDSTTDLIIDRNPSVNYDKLQDDKITTKHILDDGFNKVVSSGLKVIKAKNNQSQNRFNFIRKHSRLKKDVTEKRSLDNDVTSKISSFKLTTNLTDKELAHYRELYIRLSTKKQMEFDSQVAYLCMIFMILVICFASWYTGICRIRKHSVMDVIDFESNQPLTTVKDLVLRKSRYLPMFDDFYNKKKKVSRGTNP